MKARCSLLLVALQLTGFFSHGQCSFYLKFYNIPDLYLMQNLLPSSNNQYYAVGNFDLAGYTSLNKVDSLGDTLWSKQYCGSYLSDLQYSLDSNLVAVNQYYFFCGLTAGNSDIVFYKLHLNGDTIFTSHFGSNATDDLPQLAVLSDSTYIVTLENGGAGDNVYHLDAQGNVMSSGIMPFEFIWDVGQGKDGSIYYCGYGPDWVTGKTNENLDTLFWIHGYAIGGNWGDWFETLYALPDSNIMVTGSDGTYKINYQTGDSIWKNNLQGFNIWPLKDSSFIINHYSWIYKINNNGDSIWSKYMNMDPSHWLELNSIVELDSGCFAALGDKTTVGSNTTHEPFFAYFDSLFDFPFNVGMQNLQQTYTVTVTPNPVTTQATLQFNNEEHNKVTLTVYDVLGNVVLSDETTGSSFLIERDERKAGVYFYCLSPPAPRRGVLPLRGKFVVE